VQLTRKDDLGTPSAGNALDALDALDTSERVFHDGGSSFEVFIRKWTGEQVILRGASRSRAAELATSEARLRKRKVYVRDVFSGGTLAYRPDRTVSRSEDRVQRGERVKLPARHDRDPDPWLCGFEVFVRKWAGEQVILCGVSRARAEELARSEARLRRRTVYVRDPFSGRTIAFAPLAPLRTGSPIARGP
jgi:hypothetical protein